MFSCLGSIYMVASSYLSFKSDWTLWIFVQYTAIIIKYLQYTQNCRTFFLQKLTVNRSRFSVACVTWIISSDG
jgi:hypothetical protein